MRRIAVRCSQRGTIKFRLPGNPILVSKNVDHGAWGGCRPRYFGDVSRWLEDRAPSVNHNSNLDSRRAAGDLVVVVSRAAIAIPTDPAYRSKISSHDF